MQPPINIGETYESGHIPPIIAVVTALNPETRVVSLRTRSGTTIDCPEAELRENWKPVVAMPFRYFVRYVRLGEPAVIQTCGIARTGIIQSEGDITEMAKFITDKVCHLSPEEQLNPANEIRIIGWQAFEIPPTMVETLVAAIATLSEIYLANPTGDWYTPQLKARVQALAEIGLNDSGPAPA